MRRNVPYPFLLITAIILDRIALSSAQIDVMQSLRSLFLILLFAVFIALVIRQRVKNPHRTAFLLLLMLLMFVLYRFLYCLLKHELPQQADHLALALLPLLGLVYIAIARYKVWQNIPNPKRLAHYLNLVFAILLGFQALRLATVIRGAVVTRVYPQYTAIPPSANEAQLVDKARPDIYIIVLDAYGRQDVLQQIYGHDNLEFLQGLEERGFYVAEDSHSNYVQTSYAIASLMNHEYVQPWEPSSNYSQYLLKPIGDNRVYSSLDDIGYTTVSFESGTSFTQIENSDVRLSNFLPLNKFETLLFMDSPVEPVSDALNLEVAVPSYQTHRQRILYTFDELKRIPSSIPGPRIVYAHVLSPHPPFVFDQNGSPIEPARPYSIWDGNEFEGSPEEYINGYRNQVIFTNKQVMETIDGILANYETPPIIIIMGHHGPGSMFDWNSDAPGCLWERTGNLYAVLLPGHQHDGTLYSSISPVNTFRVIFNTYFGTDLPLLEDKSYFVSWQQPTKMVDVTNKRDSIEGCSMSED